MRFNKLTLVFAALCLCHAAQSASILALFSSLSFADHYTYRGYVEMLTRNGHSVVVMTPYPGHFQYPEVEKIVELDVSKESSQYLDEYRKLMTNVDDYFPKMRRINELAIKVAIAQLRSQQMTALFVNPNVVFDLIITEAEMPILYAAAEKYKAPQIAITSGSGSLTMYESKGTPNHPLFYPDLYTIFYEKFNIWEKLAEYLRYLRIRNEYYNNYLPLCQIAAEKIFGLKRDLLSVEHDIDLLFVSGTQTLIGNRPTSPAVIYTDRLHIKPGLALPQELKALMDGAENGCVYFSLGVIQEANQLSKAMIQTLLDAFGQLPFLVFWKIDDVNAFKKPSNVITQAWFPQQQMLAHPKMKAFITSGGAHSLDEAVFYGVPIIGLPIVSSRKVFIAQITKYGAVLQRGILRIELFRIWRSESNVLEKCECVLRFVKEKSNFNSLQTHFQNKIVKTLKNFCGQLNKKWIKCHRNENFFKEKNKLWLKGKIQFSVFSLPSTSGRPTKSFVASSESVKRRKVSSLVQNTSPEELTFATRMSLRSEGRRDAAEIVKQVTLYSPQRATNIKRRYVASQQTQMSNDEALALFIDTKLTKMQYKTIRNNAKMHNANIYPSYDQLLLAKKACYPENITVTEISAEVQLQYLVDHTIKRLIQVQSEVLVNLDFTDLSILFKWGCDGAAGQSRYKQRFSNEDYVDSFLFSVSLVPLRLIAKTSNEEQIVWQNPSTSSTRFCRPIKIIFTKETKDRVKNEVERVQTQINSLVPYQVEFNGKQITCSSLFSLTMIDGKICSWLSDISSQCCHLCGATPKLMNDLAAMKVRPVNEDNLSFGISSLHAWINTLECILHIGYRLDIKKWRITKTDKEILQVRKKQIQDRFKNELGLLIDLPKPGFGSTNDGNTARRVLHNATLTSQITGVDENLIKKLNIILITISCGFEIDADIFENYCMETAELYVTKYPWYYMPQSLHKVLIHGKKLINHAILPIGQMSEEAQESRNKDSKQFREFHSRRFSRRETMEDMMHMLLISSDPVITSLRRKVQKKKLPFPEAVLRMLKCPPVSSNTVESDDDD